MKAFLALCATLATLLVTACPPGPVYPDGGAGGSPGVGGGVVDSGEDCTPKVLDPCGLAAERLCVLQCRKADGTPRWRTPDGRPFAEVCRDARDDGRDWHPSCIAHVTDCSQVDSAYRGVVCNP